MNRRIMIVDDEPEILDILKEAFQGEGYQTILVSSGEEAINKVTKTLPDLIILDIMMPEVDGWEVLDFVKSNPTTSHIPIIILTAKGREVSRIYGLKQGADDYVVKPFSLKELLIRAKKLLGRKVKEASSESISKIPISLGNSLFFLPLEEISLVKALRKKSLIYSKGEEFSSQYSIGELEKMVGKSFFRVHRSYLVNIEKVKKIVSPDSNKMFLVVDLGDKKQQEVPVSRKKVPILRRTLNIKRLSR